MGDRRHTQLWLNEDFYDDDDIPVFSQTLSSRARTPNTFPKANHLLMSIDVGPLKRMMDPNYDPMDPQNSIERVSYYNLITTLKYTNPNTKHYTLDPMKAIVPLRRNQLVHRRGFTYYDEVFNKSMQSALVIAKMNYCSSGFSGVDDPLKDSKQAFNSIKIDKENPKRNRLLRDHRKVMKLSQGMSNIGSKKVLSTLRATGRESHWVQVNNDLCPIYKCNWDNEIEITLSENWCFLDSPRESFAFPIEGYQMICDLFRQRFNALTCCLFAEIVGSKTFPRYEDVDWVFNNFDHLSDAFGSDSMICNSQLEPMCTIALMEVGEDPICSFEELKSGIRETFTSFDRSQYQWDGGEFFDNFLNGLISIGKECPHHLSQIFGLYKMAGIPAVDPLESIQAVRIVAGATRTSDATMINHISARFKEEISIRHKKKTGSWLKMNTQLLEEDNPIRFAVEKNTFLDKGANYHVLDWNKVKFEKNFEIRNRIDMSDLISDKTLSAIQHELYNSLKENHSIGNAFNRSVLIKWLTTTMLDPVGFLLDIDQNGFPPDTRFMAVRVKEKENKLKGRLFGMTTFVMRMYIVITESLIKKFILPLFPEITIEYDSVSLTNTIYDNTNQLSGDKKKDHKKVIVNIDFNKWNSNMREDDTIDIFRDMDNLMGFNNLIARTHEMFKDTLFYLSSNYVGHTKELASDPNYKSLYTWRGHKGGIEGLRQTGWTVFTAIVLRDVLQNRGVNFNIMGQGDNQVLILKYPKDETDDQTKERHIKTMKALQNQVNSIGPPMKFEETWSSSIFFVYGKMMVFKNYQLTQSLKRMLKQYDISNEGLPTLESALSSITSNTFAAINCDTDIKVPLLMYGFSSAHCLLVHCDQSYLGSRIPNFVDGNESKGFVQHYSAKYKSEDPNRLQDKEIVFKDDIGFAAEMSSRSVRFICCFLMIPSILGGYSNFIANQAYIRKFPDPLTEAIYSLNQMRKICTDKLIKRILGNILKPVIKRGPPNAVKLVLDPVSIDIHGVTPTGEVLRSEVSRAINATSEVTNTQYKDLFTLSEMDISPFCEELIKMNPLRPLVINELFSATPVGIARDQIGKFSRTNTLTRLMISTRGDDPINRLRKADLEFFKTVYFNLVTRSEVDDDLIENTTDYAEILRYNSWSRVTRNPISGVTVSYPMSYLYPVKTIRVMPVEEQTDPSYILVRISKETLNNDLRFAQSLGPHRPMLGSRTREKFNYNTKTFSEQMPSIMSRATKALRMINWITEEGSSLSNLISIIFRSVTDLDPSYLIPDINDVKGDTDHRQNNPHVDRGGRTTLLYNNQTFHQISTDSFTRCSKGGENLDVYFQSIFVAIGSLMSFALTAGCPIEGGSSLRFYEKPGNNDLRLTNSDMSKLEEAQWDDLIPKAKDSVFAFVSKDRLGLKGENPIPLFPKWKFFERTEEENQTVALKMVSSRLASTLFTGSVEYDDYRLESSSVKKIAQSLFFDCDLLRLLKMVAIRIVVKVMIDQLHDFNVEQSPFLRVKTAVSHISTFPMSWYEPLLNLTMAPGFLQLASSSMFGLFPSSSAILEKHQSVSMLKSMIISLCNKFIQGEIREEGNFGVVVPKSYISFHPVLIKQTELVLDQIARYVKDEELLMEESGDETDGGVEFEGDYTRYDRFITVLLSLKEMFYSLRKSDLDVSSDLYHYNKSWDTQLKIGINQTMRKTLTSFSKYFPVFTGDGLPEMVAKAYPTKMEIESKETDGFNISTDIESSCEVFGNLTHEADFRVQERTFHLEDDPYETTRTNRVSHSSYRRPCVGPTGAGYKLLSMWKELGLSDDMKLTGDFGFGAGTMSQILLRILHNNKHFVADLIDYDSTEPNALTNQYPPCFSSTPSLIPRLYKTALTYECRSDFLEVDYPDFLSKNLNMGLDFFVVDIEGSFTDRTKMVRILLNSLKIGRLMSTKKMLVKAYLSSQKSFEMILMIAANGSKKISVLRSHFSKTGSSEVYLLLEGPFSSPDVDVNPMCVTVRGHVQLRDVVSTYQKFEESTKIFPSKAKSMSYHKILKLNSGDQVGETILENMCPLLMNKVRSDQKYIFPNECLKEVKFAKNYREVSKTKRKLGSKSYLTQSEISKAVQNLYACAIFASEKIEDCIKVELQSEKSYIVYYRTLAGNWDIAVIPHEVDPKDLVRVSKLSDHLSMAFKKKVASLWELFRDKYGDNIIHVTKNQQNIWNPRITIKRVYDQDKDKDIRFPMKGNKIYDMSQLPTNHDFTYILTGLTVDEWIKLGAKFTSSHLMIRPKGVPSLMSRRWWETQAKIQDIYL